MCRPYVHVRDIDKADELLMSFCTGVETLYGNEAITPNMHLHGHLKNVFLMSVHSILFGATHLNDTMGFL